MGEIENARQAGRLHHKKAGRPRQNRKNAGPSPRPSPQREEGGRGWANYTCATAADGSARLSASEVSRAIVRLTCHLPCASPWTSQ